MESRRPLPRSLVVMVLLLILAGIAIIITWRLTGGDGNRPVVLTGPSDSTPSTPTPPAGPPPSPVPRRSGTPLPLNRAPRPGRATSPACGGSPSTRQSH